MNTLPPIAYAVKASSLDLIIARIESGLDVNFIDDRGDTAINLASKYANTEIIKLLLSHKADPYKLDGHGKDAFYYCFGNSKTKASLKGLDINAFETKDDNLEVSHINLDKIKSRFKLKKSTFQTIANLQNCLVDNFNIEIDDASMLNRKIIGNYMEYIADKENDILCEIINQYTNKIQKTWEIGGERNKLPLIKSIEEFIMTFKPVWNICYFDNEVFITLVKGIDGERDLHVSLGYNILVKNVWIE